METRTPPFRILKQLSLAAPLLQLAGCAHYSLPVNQLDSPEALGASNTGHIELLPLMSGPNLNDPPSRNPGEKPTDPVTYSASQSFRPGLGLTAGLSERVDLGIRFTANAPITLRAKYQFMGEPEKTAKQGNFSASVLAAPGFLSGSSGNTTSRILSADVRLLGGYRIFDRHLLSLGPFYSFAHVAGNVPLTSSSMAQASAGANASSGSGTGTVSLYGACLGYQYNVLDLVFRTEVAYAAGKVGPTVQVGSVFVGGYVGLALH